MILLCYGTRPELIKLFPLAIELKRKLVNYQTLFTGQHKHLIKDFEYYLSILSKFSEWIGEKSKTQKDDVSAAANDYLRSLGYVSIAYAWIKILDVSFSDFEKNKEFYSDKINTAKFYFDKVLPRAEYHYKSAITGSSNIMNFKFN